MLIALETNTEGKDEHEITIMFTGKDKDAVKKILQELQYNLDVYVPDEADETPEENNGAITLGTMPGSMPCSGGVTE